MPRLKPRPIDRSLSEPSRLREIAEPAGVEFSIPSSTGHNNVFSQRDFYEGFLASLSTRSTEEEEKDLQQWRQNNDLDSERYMGTFAGKRQEETFVMSQSMYTDKSMQAFFVLYFFVFLVSLFTELRRIDSSFDVGPASRLLRTSLLSFMLCLISAILVKRRRDSEFFVSWKEQRRVMTARVFTFFWFFYFPTIHAPILGITLPKAFKLRFRHSAEIVLTATFMSLCIAVITSTSFKWNSFYGAQIAVMILLFNLGILRGSDHRARVRFVHGAHRFEVSRRVLEMAKRLRAAQAFASASWKSDNTVMALRRIREDPVLADEYAHQLVLDVSVSTIAHSREASSNISDIWNPKHAASWAHPPGHTSPSNVTAPAITSSSPQTPQTKANIRHHQLLSKLLDWSPNAVQLPPSGYNDRAGSMYTNGADTTPSMSLPTHFRRASSLTETEGRQESELLEPLMSDWNFGAAAGIWAHISDRRFSMFSSRPLVCTMLTALDSYGFFDPDISVNEDGVRALGPYLNKSTVLRYFAAVEAAYNPKDEVPYHNALHAVDVVQTVFAMTKLDADALHDMPRLALFALLFGAAIHDVGHPGVNNSHLVACGHELALRYNDRSVLENFHASRAFSILVSSPELDALDFVGVRDKQCGTQHARVFRSMVIEMVLATDLSHHFDCQARFRAKLAGDVNFSDVTDTSLVCSILLHAADVGNVAKTWAAYEPWIELLFSEFFAQGDREKKMGLSTAPFMDRDVSVPEKAQSAFISNIVLPLYQVMADFVPNTAGAAMENMRKNLAMLDRKAREKEASSRTSPAASLETILSQLDESGSVEEAKQPDDDYDAD